MRIFKLAYIVITLLVFLDLSLYVTCHISLPGHWIDWVLFYSWFFATIFLLITCFRERGVKIYTVALSIFIALTMLPMMMPFVMILSFALNTVDVRYKVSKELELQEHTISPVAIPHVVAIRSYGIYEQIIAETEFSFEVNDVSYRIEDAISIQALNIDLPTNKLSVEFKFKDGIVVRKFVRKH